MICPKCGKDNFETARFCRRCGHMLAAEEEVDTMFADIVGLKSVKKQLLDVVKMHDALLQHRVSEMNKFRLNKNILISGNTGTGKTLLCECIQRIFYKHHIISQNKLIHLDATELETWLAQTDSSKLIGGIVCIENVQKLVPAGAADEDRIRVIDSLLNQIEHWGGDPIVILTGLQSTFNRYIEMNPDVSNRFSLYFKLQSYSIDELVLMSKLKLGYWGYTLSKDAEEKLCRVYKNDLRSCDNIFQNGHLVVHRVESIIKNIALRSKDDITIRPEDIKGKEYYMSTPQDILDSLDKYVGIEDIKSCVQRLIDNIQIEKKRNPNKPPQIKDHYLFLGNPGTGKTTIARVFADIFSALDVLPIGQLVEVSRQDMVAGYVGQTAINVEKLVDRAMGGVLFIDEAYTLIQNENDSFGKEAIDTLLKLMEDRRGKFVVIAAGYTKEMETFIGSNPGLSSRFTERINFRDYTSDELSEIFRRLVNGNDLILSDDAKDYVPKFFNRMYVSRTRNFANARSVRIAFENTLKNQAERLRALFLKQGDDPSITRIITSDDIKGTEDANKDLSQVLKEIDSMIGMDSVKTAIHELSNKLLVQRKMEEMNISTAQLEPIHIVLTGNPGTGKTTIAKKLGEVFYAIGLLPTSKVVCKERKDLISIYQNETAKLVDKACDEAMGGILFIDEAYSLMPISASGSKDQSGVEAVESLMTRMVSDAGKFVVICAGYKKEMDEFIRTANPGFSRRFTHRLHIDDYSSSELIAIFKQIAHKNNDIIDAAVEDVLQKKIQQMVDAKDENFGNVGEIVKLYNEVKSRRSNRIAQMLMEGKDVSRDIMLTIIPSDIPYYAPKTASIDECLKQLQDLVGLDNVKQEIFEMVSLINTQKLRSESLGIPFHPGNEHYLFTGNPGTGKTTVARIMAEVFHTLGMLPTNNLTEVTRKDLVAPYVGQTASMTSRQIRNAVGGVFFIDEAYTLNQGGSDTFGQEATDTLLPALVDYKDKMVCIAAGYTNEIHQWVQTNPGLQSRFTREIHFDDYTADELLEIFMRLCSKEQFELEDDALQAVKQHLQTLYDNRGRNFANAREVNNLFLHVKKRQSARIQTQSMSQTIDISEISIIKKEDII